ncbi:MAG: hypothetical protein HC881_02730 [Leptolyngbyaceae cyanobacterium SL_7_1]|nr:hypothetical protein [Leptolyngbyaceae cyanobacterium SL_7_1]
MSSDSTAFLAGCAITGVAAVLLLRGGLLAEQPRSSPSLSSPPALSAPASNPSIMGLSPQQEWRTEQQIEEQRILTQDLKAQLDRQRTETDALKTELERQRSETDQLVAQMQQQLETQQRLIDTINVQQQIGTADRDRVADQLRAIEPRANYSTDQPIRLQSTLLWAVGVTLIVIALGGGVVLIVLIVLLAQSQRRYPRTVNVIHPMAAPPYPLAAQALLPSQTRPTKRTTQVDYLDD